MRGVEKFYTLLNFSPSKDGKWTSQSRTVDGFGPSERSSQSQVKKEVKEKMQERTEGEKGRPFHSCSIPTQHTYSGLLPTVAWEVVVSLPFNIFFCCIGQ